MSRLDDMVKNLCPDGVEYIAIGDLIRRVKEKGKDDKSVSQVYVVSNSQGIVKAEDYRENAVNSEDTSSYTILRKGMVAYNPSRLNIGSIAILKNEQAGLVSPMYVVFSIDNSRLINEYFWYVVTSSPTYARKTR